MRLATAAILAGAITAAALAARCVGLRSQADIKTAGAVGRMGDRTDTRQAQASSETAGDGNTTTTIAGGHGDSITSMILAAGGLAIAIGDGPIRRKWRDRRGCLEKECKDLRRRLEALERAGDQRGA